MIKDFIIDYTENMQIIEPCIIRNMPIELYHAHPALSNSGLKMLADCPAKYYYKYLSGEYEPKEKPCFKIGKACHTIILEGKEAFYNKYWHNPYKGVLKENILNLLQEKCRLLFSCELKYLPLRGRTKIFNYSKLIRAIKRLHKKYGEVKSIKDYLLNELIELLLIVDNIEQKEIELDKNELNQVIGVSRSINNNLHAKGAFSQKGESELSLFWQDKETGLWLKCRPDFLPYNCKLVPDYKTAQSANPSVFYGDFIKFGYHAQAATYRKGIFEVTKHLLGAPIEVKTFFFIVQEKEAPYITQVFVPPMNLVDFGYKKMRAGLNKFIECSEREIWPAYSENVIEMSIELKPNDLAGNFDDENSICYAPAWIDAELGRY